MRRKAILGLILKLLGCLLFVPSIIVLFFGAIALRLLPWYPQLETVFAWGMCLAFAALVGFALLKQSALFAAKEGAILKEGLCRAKRPETEPPSQSE
jgi:hypothetical protein